MFSYCNNSPIAYIDPDGYVAVVDDLVFFALTTLVVLPVMYVVVVPPPPIQSLIHDGIKQTINNVSEMVDQAAEALLAKTKGKERVRDTGLANESDAEIQKKAHDKSIPKSERERYKTEEKARGLRNVQKRK